jgi:hypothetical protein
VTDVADMTIKHPLFKQAIRLIGIQQPETDRAQRVQHPDDGHAGELRQRQGQPRRAASPPT